MVSYLLDTASLLIVVAYNARQHFPFSTYGENAFLVIQNVVIVYVRKAVEAIIIGCLTDLCHDLLIASLLVIAYSRTSGKAIKAATFMSAIGASAYALSNSELVNIDFLRTLLAASIPLSLSSKVPQIAKIYSQGSTGQLSAFLVFNSLAGCLARVFTTMTETGDKTLWWSFVSASVLNGVIALQMLYYWNASSRESKVAGKKSKSSSGRTVESQLKEKANGGAVPVLSPPTSSGSTAAVVSPVTPGKAQGAPARQPASSAKRSASRNYTRKVD